MRSRFSVRRLRRAHSTSDLMPTHDSPLSDLLENSAVVQVRCRQRFETSASFCLQTAPHACTSVLLCLKAIITHAALVVHCASMIACYSIVIPHLALASGSAISRISRLSQSLSTMLLFGSF